MRKIKKQLIRVISFIGATSLLAGFVMPNFKPRETQANVAAKPNFTQSNIIKTNASIDTNREAFYDPNVVYQLPSEVTENQLLSVIVKMDKDSVMDTYDKADSGQTLTDYINSRTGRSVANEIQTAQNSFLSKLKKSGIKYTVGERYDTIFSGFEINIKAKDFKAVGEVFGDSATLIIGDEYEKSNYTVVTNDVDVYETGIFNSSSSKYQGDGVVVAVLDTGLDYTHSAFSVDNFTTTKEAFTLKNVSEKVKNTTAAEFTSGLQGEDVYVNRKVPFAYDYADKDPDVLPINSEHGTHVAGIIAGNDDRITGVAPNAQLAIMKVFSDLQDGAKDSWILAAVEDCVTLGVDVVNMSLGSSCGFTREEDKEEKNDIYNSVREAGISLIAAAANDGNATQGSEKNGSNPLTSNPDSGTIGAPSTYPAALAVASVDGVKTPYMLHNDDIIYFTEASTTDATKKKSFVDDILKTLGDDVQSHDFEYVTIPGIGRSSDYPQEADFYAGKIVLVKRGTTTFEDKVRVALKEKGAAGIIIYNNVSGKISMAVGEDVGAVCSIPQDEGEKLAAAETGIIRISREQKAGPFMSDFSSWGPTSDLKIKPEITAHGGEIESAVPGQEYDRLSGTSMAAPNQAGATALIRQYVRYSGEFGTFNEELTKEEAQRVTALVNQIMMSTADIIHNKNGVPAAVRKQGAGLVNISKATDVEAYLTTYENGEVMDKTKLELGDDKDRTGVYDNIKFAINNISGSPVSYDIGAIVMTEGVSTTYTGHDDTTSTQEGYILEGANFKVTTVDGAAVEGNQVTVPAGKTVVITATVTLSDADKQYLEKSFKYGMYVEGFITLTAANGTKHNLNVPMLAFYGDWTEAPIFDEEYYDTHKDEINKGLDPEDKLMADAYATRAVGSLYDDYISILGSYYFIQDPSATQIAANKDYISLSNQQSKSNSSINGISSIWAGLLRNAKEMDIRIVEDATGEVIFETAEYNVRKSYSRGLTMYQTSVDVDFSVLEHKLKNNTKYTVTVESYIDYGTKEEQNNARNVFEFPLYIDFEAPTLTDVAYRTEDDATTKKTKLFADISVYDNHYAMGMQLGQVLPADYDKTGYNFTIDTFGKYITPIYSSRNSVSTVTVELTDYISRIKQSAGIGYNENNEFFVDKNNNSFLVVCYDYAMNAATYEVRLPDEILAMNFTEDTVNINPNQTLDLSTVLNVFPDSSWVQVLDFNVSEADKEIIDVVNQTVIAKKSGDATITAIGRDHNGNEVSDTLVIHVLSPGEEGYDGSYTIPQVNKFSITGYKTEKAFYAVNNSDRDIGLTGDNRSFGDSLSLSMFPSESVTLAHILDSYYPDRTTVTYKAGNSRIATVNEKGTIVAQAEGNTTITVNVQFDGKSTLYSARINVAVKDPFTTNSIYLMNYRGLGGEVIIPDDRGLTMIYQYAFSNYEYIAKDLDAGDVINDEDPYNTKPWFIGEHTITKVVIPEGITHIQAYAFANLTALEEVVMPSTLKTIGVGAFYNCSRLKKINLEHVKFANADAFNGCYSLEEITLDSIVAIGNNTFANCNIKNLNLPKSSQSLGKGAFAYNEELDNVTFNASKIKIGERAFYGCERLTSIDINAAVISPYAFYNCENLTNVTLGKDVAVIGEYAFMGTNVAKFNLARGCVLGSEADGALIYSDKTLKKLLVAAPQYAGNSVNTVITSAEEIGAGAFAGNKKIRFIEANQATSIGAYAFAGCAQLRNVSLDKVVEISDFAFMGTPITETPNLTAIATIGRYAFAQTKIESLVIPDGAVIEDSAFVNCSQLESVTIGNGVVIGDYAFQTSLSLQIFELARTQEAQIERLNAYYNDIYSYVVYDDEGNALETLSYRRYDRFEKDCTSKLKTVSLGEMVTVGAHAFEGNTKLTTLTVGAGTTIGDYAFYNAASLANADLSKVVSIGEYAFSGDNIMEFSLSNAGWAFAYEKAYIDGEIKALDYKYMSLAPVIKSVDLSSATYIGKAAFAYNRALENIVFAESAAEGSALTTIADYAFSDCESLKVLNLPSYVTKIGAFAFSGSKLSEIDARNVTEVGDSAFAFNTLKKINLKENASIGDHAFYFNFYLTDVENLDTVTAIGAFAFAETKITEVALTKVAHVGDFAFSNSLLTKVTLGKQLISFGENPFYGCEIETFAREKKVEFNDTVISTEMEESYDVSATVKVINDALYQMLPNGAYELVSYPAKKAAKNVEIVEGTARISAKAFAGTSLESVTLPASLKSIGDKAFYQCENLAVVIFKSYEAPILEEEYDTAYITAESLPFTGKIEMYKGELTEGLGIVDYYMWNVTSAYNNFYFGANFVDYIGHIDNKIVMVKPANGQGYDTFIMSQYFSTVVQGSNAAMDRTLSVIAMIAGLPTNITLNDEAKVVAARAAYDAIPSIEQKALVSNYSTLESAESMIAYLKLRDEQGNGSTDSSVEDTDKKKGCGGCNSIVGGGLGALTLLAVGFAMVKGKGSKNDL